MDKMVCIVLLNYKNTKDTIDCVESLNRISYKNYKVVIVDNDSKDGSFEKLSKEFGDNDKVYVIESKRNGGFAFGNNVGIKYARDKFSPDYFMLLNNDTVVEEDFLEELLKPFEKDSSIGLTTGKILYYDNKDIIWYAGGEIDWNKFYGYHLKSREKDDNCKDEKHITFATGCLMLISKEALDKVGLLPEEYFMYYEDVDFCASLLKAGYKIYYNPKSVIYHKVSSATGGEESAFAVRWNTRNRILFMNKYKDRVSTGKFALSKLFFYSTRFIKVFQYRLKGNSDKAFAIKQGIKDSKIRNK